MNTRTRTNSVLTFAAVAIATLALTATSADAAPITGLSYSADLAPFVNAPWNDAGGDPTASGGVSWGDSELFDGTIATSGTSNVVGWYAVSVGEPTLTFDLGSVYDVQEIEVWRRAGNGVLDHLDVSVSTDDVTYTPATPVTFSTWSSNKATLNVSALDNARYVKMKLRQDNLDWTMLTEVAFDGDAVASVPEPNAFALGILGILGLVGLRLRRRRR